MCDIFLTLMRKLSKRDDIFRFLLMHQLVNLSPVAMLLFINSVSPELPKNLKIMNVYCLSIKEELWSRPTELF